MVILVLLVILWNYISKSYKLPNFVPNNLDKTKISRYKDIMEQKYITQWRYSVDYTRKLEFYVLFNKRAGVFYRV